MSQAKKDRFLEVYPKIGTVRAASEAAGISYRTFYRWLEADDNFAAEFAHAKEAAADRLEEALIERAMERSDVAAIFILKGLRPDKYRERQAVRHEGGVNVAPVKVTVERVEAPAKE